MGGVGALKMGQNAHKNRGDNLHVNILFYFILFVHGRCYGKSTRVFGSCILGRKYHQVNLLFGWSKRRISFSF